MKLLSTAVRSLFVSVTMLGVTTAGSLLGGAIILDGTDSNDHGSAGAGGWLYMRAALNNIAGQLGTVPTETLNVVGTTSGGQAQQAIAWAFANSNLPGSGWSINYIPLAGVSSFLSTLSISNTGILYVPTIGNTSGDLADSAITSLTTNAAQINNFTADGGGLFAEAESPVTSGLTSYSWVQSLLPGLGVTDGGSGGFSNATLTLTTAGHTAFPGLTNADLSTGPWHNYFSGGSGGLTVLATGVNDAGVTVPVIIGNSGGSITTSGSTVPEPTTAVFLGSGLLVLTLAMNKRRTAKIPRPPTWGDPSWGDPS